MAKRGAEGEASRRLCETNTVYRSVNALFTKQEFHINNVHNYDLGRMVGQNPMRKEQNEKSHRNTSRFEMKYKANLGKRADGYLLQLSSREIGVRKAVHKTLSKIANLFQYRKRELEARHPFFPGKPLEEFPESLP